MSAIDTLIADLKAGKYSALPQEVIAPVDDFVAALQFIAAGIPSAPSGPAGGDLSGNYPGPTVSGLQGKAVSNTAPTNGQVLQWNNAAQQWQPTTAAAGGPAVVQQANLAGTNGAVTMGVAPTNGNLLVALLSTQSVNPSAAAGWTIVPGSNSTNSQDDLVAFYKVAGAGESTSQTPSNDTATGCTTIFEISSATTAVYAGIGSLSGTAVFTNSITTQLGLLILGAVSCHSATAVINALNGTTANGSLTQGGARSVQALHVTAPVQGANANKGLTWTATQAGSVMLIEIG